MANKKRKNRYKKKIKLKNNGQWIKEYASQLKENLPKSEQWFSEILVREKLDHLFMNNIPINNKYIVDYKHKSRKIIIEIDGSIHDLPEVIERDKKREQHLKQLGFTIIRIKAFCDDSLKSGLNKIKSYIKPNEKIDVRPNVIRSRQKRPSKMSKSMKEHKCHLCDRLEHLKTVSLDGTFFQLCPGHNGHFNKLRQSNDVKIYKYMKLDV